MRRKPTVPLKEEVKHGHGFSEVKSALSAEKKAFWYSTFGPVWKDDGRSIASLPGPI